MMKFQKKNPLLFSNFLKEPLLLQKQMIHQQKALDLRQPKSGHGMIRTVPRPPAAKSIFLLNFTAVRWVFDFLPSMTS